MAAVITSKHPASPDATALIAELDAHLTPLYPSGWPAQKRSRPLLELEVLRARWRPFTMMLLPTMSCPRQTGALLAYRP